MAGGQTTDLDPVFRKLGARGWFQIWQLIIGSAGQLTAALQLYGNVFLAQDIPFKCAPAPPNATGQSELGEGTGNWSDIQYDQCHIIFRDNITDDVREEKQDCLYGYQYEWHKDASVVSDFDLVCDRYLLVSLSQTFVVLGQGIGAFIASMMSDRFGRKPVLVGSQLGLLIMGMAIGMAPSFPIFALFKCCVGIFQQSMPEFVYLKQLQISDLLNQQPVLIFMGVVTTINTLGIELFPKEQRSLSGLIVCLLWATGACCLALFAFLLRFESWRVLQYSMSSLSIFLLVLHFFYMEESIRWLVDNGKEEKVAHVLKRAARTNKKNLDVVMATLRDSRQDSSTPPGSVELSTNASQTADQEAGSPLVKPDPEIQMNGHARNLKLEATRKLTLLDLFRHKRLLVNSLITFLAWFTVAFVVFTLYMMSTSYAGNPYINYFFTAFMEVPPAIMLFVGVDRLGRKRTLQGFYAAAGFGCIISAICLIFQDNSTLGVMSAVFAMLGMVGGSGAFGLIFFYVPELFPTNLRNQALGTGSAVGRIGGMLAPFMKNLSLVVIWGPGVITSSLCAAVVFFLQFLPETRGRPLPSEIKDIEAWYSKKGAGKGEKQTESVS